MLLLSELGHNFQAFDEQGWSLLKIFITNGYPMVFLKTIFTLFKTFYKVQGTLILESHAFRETFDLFWSKYGDNEAFIGEAKLMVQSHSKRTDLYSHEDTFFFLGLWTRCIFSHSYWTGCKNAMVLLDEICHILFMQHEISMMRKCLWEEYQKMTNRSLNTSKSSFQTIYGFAVGSNNGFPSILPNVGLAITEMFTSEKPIYPFYTLIALSVEAEAEREIRQELGKNLIQGLVLTDPAMQFPKPFKEMAIFRFLECIQKLPRAHPIYLLYFQGFFNLYLESIKSSTGIQKNIGALFVQNAPKGLLGAHEIFQVIKDCILDIESVEGPLQTPLISIWSAFVVWMTDGPQWDEESIKKLQNDHMANFFIECYSTSTFKNQSWWLQWVQLHEEPDSCLSQSIELLSLEPIPDFEAIKFETPIILV